MYCWNFFFIFVLFQSEDFYGNNVCVCVKQCVDCCCIIQPTGEVMSNIKQRACVCVCVVSRVMYDSWLLPGAVYSYFFFFLLVNVYSYYSYYTSILVLYRMWTLRGLAPQSHENEEFVWNLKLKYKVRGMAHWKINSWYFNIIKFYYT